MPLAPVAGAVKVTTTPPTGLLPLSKTVTEKGGKAELMAALGDAGLVSLIVAGAEIVFVRLNVATAAAPGAEAVTVYAPAIAFAVKLAGVAMPSELVVAVLVADDVSEKTPLGPVVGALKVTTIPVAGNPFEVTVTASAVP